MCVILIGDWKMEVRLSCICGWVMMLSGREWLFGLIGGLKRMLFLVGIVIENMIWRFSCMRVLCLGCLR